jgi:hypothetical protein
VGNCPFPEHHQSSGWGSWWPLVVAIGAVALLAPLVNVIINVIALVLTFTGIAALAAGGGWVWWRLAHRQPRALVYRPQVTQAQPRWGQPALPRGISSRRSGYRVGCTCTCTA